MSEVDGYFVYVVDYVPEENAQLIAAAVNALPELLNAAEDRDMWEASAKEHMAIAAAQSRELDRHRKALEVALRYAAPDAPALEEIDRILAGDE